MIEARERLTGLVGAGYGEPRGTEMYGNVLGSMVAILRSHTAGNVT